MPDSLDLIDAMAIGFCERIHGIGAWGEIRPSARNELRSIACCAVRSINGSGTWAVVPREATDGMCSAAAQYGYTDYDNIGVEKVL